jgi:hypothetical protein
MNRRQIGRGDSNRRETVCPPEKLRLLIEGNDPIDELLEAAVDGNEILLR